MMPEVNEGEHRDGKVTRITESPSRRPEDARNGGKDQMAGEDGEARRRRLDGGKDKREVGIR